MSRDFQFDRKRKSHPLVTGVFIGLLVGLCLALAVALPLLAEQVRVYQDGNAWIEETTGTLPMSHDLRVNTDIGSIEMHGRAQNVVYVIRKRTIAATKQDAERDFQQARTKL